MNIISLEIGKLYGVKSLMKTTKTYLPFRITTVVYMKYINITRLGKYYYLKPLHIVN